MSSSLLDILDKGPEAVLDALSPPPDARLAGYAWLENLRCDPISKSLFVSEWARGELWRFQPNAPAAASPYTRTLHLGPDQGFAKFLGLALNGTTLFGTGTLKSGDNVVFSMSTTVPFKFDQLAKLPKRGNGMAFDADKGVLYVTTEGSFIPWNGDVYTINVATGKVGTVLSKGFFDDGAYIDPERRLLYVSEVVTATVLVIDLDSGAVTAKYKPPGVGWLDDFTLGDNYATLLGADFEHGRVVEVSPANPKPGEDVSTTILAEGFKNPTSVRWGCLHGGAGLNSSSLFVTEGGGLKASVNSRRLLEIHGQRPPRSV